MRRPRPAILLCFFFALSCAGLTPIKRGVLVRNGQQTSCELLVLDSKASLVAASCLDYVNNGVVDKNVSYDVYLDDSRGESAAKYRVESFTTHPKYSPVTFTNNLAVLQYNSKGKITWTNPVAAYPDLGFSGGAYSRRTLDDLGAMKWGDVQSHKLTKDQSYALTNGDGEDRRCSDVAIVPSDISNHIASTYATTTVTASGLSNCSSPYSNFYITLKDGDAELNGSVPRDDMDLLLGMYSHTFVRGGSNLCRNNAQCSYYTLIWSFSGYIAQVLGRNINIRSGYGSNGPNEDPNFIMKPVAYNTSGLVTLSGNLFNARDVITESSRDASSSNTSSDQPREQPSSSDSSPNEQQDRSGGLSRGAAIGIGVGATAGGLLLIAAVVFCVIRLRRRRAAGDIDQVGRAYVRDLLANELAAPAEVPRALSGDFTPPAQVHDDLPPVYEDARRDVAVHPAVSNQGFGGASFGSEKGGDMRKA